MNAHHQAVPKVPLSFALWDLHDHLRKVFDIGGTSATPQRLLAEMSTPNVKASWSQEQLLTVATAAGFVQAFCKLYALDEAQLISAFKYDGYAEAQSEFLRVVGRVVSRMPSLFEQPAANIEGDGVADDDNEPEDDDTEADDDTEPDDDTEAGDDDFNDAESFCLAPNDAREKKALKVLLRSQVEIEMVGDLLSRIEKRQKQAAALFATSEAKVAT